MFGVSELNPAAPEGYCWPVRDQGVLLQAKPAQPPGCLPEGKGPSCCPVKSAGSCALAKYQTRERWSRRPEATSSAVDMHSNKTPRPAQPYPQRINLVSENQPLQKTNPEGSDAEGKHCQDKAFPPPLPLQGRAQSPHHSLQ